MKDNYIKAVLDQCQSGQDPETILVGLQRTLARKGHTQLYPSILRGVVRVLGSANADAATVTVVSHDSLVKQKAVIDEAFRQLNAEQEPKIVVDETIVGGFIVEANSQRLDQSHKTKLVKLYRTLTK